MYTPVLPVGIRTMRYFMPPAVDFYYPMVEGLRDMSVQHRINHQITGLMHRIISELQQPGLTTYITGSFEIKANERNVLSIALNGLGEFGGAHPMTYVHSLNFDVTTGVDFPLHTQFKPDSNYVERLSEMVKLQIEERNIPMLGEFPGISPDQEYYIADNAIVLYFQLYEISPYAAGFPYFPIPLYKIQDMLAENSLLEKMIYII